MYLRIGGLFYHQPLVACLIPEPVLVPAPYLYLRYRAANELLGFVRISRLRRGAGNTRHVSCVSVRKTMRRIVLLPLNAKPLRMEGVGLMGWAS